jgi:hypothetical protein
MTSSNPAVVMRATRAPYSLQQSVGADGGAMEKSQRGIAVLRLCRFANFLQSFGDGA